MKFKESESFALQELITKIEILINEKAEKLQKLREQVAQEEADLCKDITSLETITKNNFQYMMNKVAETKSHSHTAKLLEIREEEEL